MSDESYRSRLFIVSAFFVLLGLVLAAKLFFTQIITGQDYRRLADDQHSQTPRSSFNRGSIFFAGRDGALVSGATLESGFTLVINPTLIDQPAKIFQSLKSILPTLAESDFMTRVSRRSDPYEEIASRLSEAEATAVRRLGLGGVQIIEERYRAYPGGELAAPVLGFMGYQGDDYAGRYGLEKQYDEFLRRDNKLTFANFLSELFANPIKTSRTEAARGVQGDIIVNLEPNVQRFLENQLETVMERWQTKAAGGIILDPASGAIFALAARPAFDPGQKQSDLSVLANPLISNVYEMGSIMKPLTLAAGLDAGVVDEATIYNDEGRVLIDGKIISNYDGRARGEVPLQEILNQSLNTGAVFVLRRLGGAAFYDYLTKFGLGEKTGIDLPSETSGLVGNLKSGREIEFATAAFGQGIALTPLNITMALSTLANGGRLLKPQIVKNKRYQNGFNKAPAPETVRQTIKPETARRLTAMLVKTVDEALIGGRARLPHYRVAAKTGTAQIPEKGGGYKTDKFLHSFFGYFPATAPRFSIFLYAVEPLGASYASETLTEPFSQLTKFLLNYYQVPPDR